MVVYPILLLFSDENLNDKARGNHLLSELQKAKIVDFISDNNLGEACFAQDKSEISTLDAWEKVWEYAKTECKIQENKNSCEDVPQLRRVFRQWRYTLNKHRRQVETSGEGAVKPLTDIDERYKILLDGVNGIARGLQVNTFLLNILVVTCVVVL